MKRLNLNKKAQEEMVGFGIIVGIVLIILVIIMGFYLAKQQTNVISDKKVTSFVISLLQQTTDCSLSGGNEKASINDVIFACIEGEQCRNVVGSDSCEFLKEEIKKISNISWAPGPDSVVKGYKVILKEGEEVIFEVSDGNTIGTLREGVPQRLGRHSARIYYWVYK
jgi:hypothetical protein